MMHPSPLLLAVIAALAFGVAGTSAARAENPGPAAIAPLAAEAPDPEAYWRARAESARERVAAAQTELYAAKGNISRMRRRNHPRGEARGVIYASRDAAQVKLDIARHHLEVELPRQAEQAGADGSWLRK